VLLSSVKVVARTLPAALVGPRLRDETDGLADRALLVRSFEVRQMADDERQEPEPPDGDQAHGERERIEAGIEGGKAMGEWHARGERARDDQSTLTGGGAQTAGGNPMGGGGRGVDSTPAGPGEQDSSPAAETGGPRGAGTSVSRTSGGWFDPESTQPVDPDEWIKKETSMQPKKPLARE